MRTETAPTPPETVRLADYTPPAWLVESVRLDVDLAPSATRVRARIAFYRNPGHGRERPDLRLDGRSLTFVSATVDGRDVAADLAHDREGLTLPAAALPGDAFQWDCTVEIDPAANTALEGLYLSNAMFCTQCEAEGFRKIAYYPDRPDVMAPFHVRIEAEREACPVLLSNGNPGEVGDLGGGRHFAEWLDPHPKPAYLFALVAGQLVAHEDSFTTASGQEVALKLWVRPGDEGKCAYAMDALKRSMRWDETEYGLEYDLDIFQIVAVDDFNMGAMENKGLNVFNSKYVLASPETATDRDYELIEGIVAHEYFHNWTGNRITCRDWFQLCLKEGLTVFRDQQFSADQRSAPVQRIGDVKALRGRQFPEDQGPLAHPVRPEHYVEINNFYTATVYEKGAEVIRMLHTLVGAEGYRKALDLYFERHDGQACTIEQFRQCFEDATGRVLDQFALWWSQAGTPRLKLAEVWDAPTGTLTVRLTQHTPPTPGQDEKHALVLPIVLAGVAPGGGEAIPERLIELSTPETELRFEGLSERPVLSLLRGFSAPVVVEREITPEQRAVLLAHDADPFNRWEAGRGLSVAVALDRVRQGTRIPDLWTEAMARMLADDSLDPAFRALALDVPGDDEIAREIAGQGGLADPNAIHAALSEMREHLGSRLSADLNATYTAMRVEGPYSPDAESAGRRALANRCLALLAATRDRTAFELADAQLQRADNMSETLPALASLTYYDAPSAERHLDAFHERWKGDALVIDKWLSVQATAPLGRTLATVDRLTRHPSFNWKNPNKFRALIGAFAMGNPVAFHAGDGSGYRFVTEWLLRLDAHNPQTAARLAGCFESWRRYTPERQEAMQAALTQMREAADLSKNTREMVERMLGA
ncbi:MAG: aminopeptidase N [Pseudomonadota bacterium]